MPPNLLKFLFEDSQTAESFAAELQDEQALAHLLEAIGNEKMEIRAKPLLAAIKDVLDLDDTKLEAYTDGIKLKVGCAEQYNQIKRQLSEPDTVAKLAELGWVVASSGDVSTSQEPACYVLKFLELTTADTGKGDETVKDFDGSMKAAAKKDLSEPIPDPEFTYAPDELPDPKKKNESIDPDPEVSGINMDRSSPNFTGGQQAFDVFLNGKNIDTIFYSKSANVDEDEVKRSLIDHDGYDSGITVRRARRGARQT